jgi:serine/threonine protein kinase
VPRAAAAPNEANKPQPLADLPALRHRNIVALREAIPVGEFLLLASEYCPGDTVEGLIRRLGPLTVRQAVSLVLPCLDALNCAHRFARTDGSIGVMHGNITPANLFLTWSDNQPFTKLADFGLATPALPDPAFTPRPQILEPTRAPACDVDMWRLAACLYFMLTGSGPRHFSSGEDPANVVISTVAVPIRRRDPAIAPPVAAVIDEALIDNPHIRIQSAGHLAHALRETVFVRFG